MKQPCYNDRGVVRAKLRDYKGAIEDYNQALRINPNEPTLYNNRGIIRLELGDKTGAADVQKAADLFLQQGDIENYQLMLRFLRLRKL
jgi:Flp pilus assembly protein TadD